MPSKMDRKACLPLFFAIKQDDGAYKVYQNQIKQSFKTLGFPQNNVWPVDDIVLGKLSKTAFLVKKNNTFVRRWSGGWTRSCSWVHTNMEVEMYIEDDKRFVPIIDIDHSDVLPFNSAVFQHMRG
jgi:hypothetical protein